MSDGNLFAAIPAVLPDELFERLAGNDSVSIERILSRGHVTPEGEWYDQERNEWVVVLKGAARICFDDGREVALAVGDYLDLPAHCRHRVSWSDPDIETVWLAVHY